MALQSVLTECVCPELGGQHAATVQGKGARPTPFRAEHICRLQQAETGDKLCQAEA